MSIRNENFDLFWGKVNGIASDLEVDVPVLHRRRKVPRFEEGNAPLEYPSTPKDMYRRVCPGSSSTNNPSSLVIRYMVV